MMPDDPRPTWFLGPGAMPIPASARKVPAGCTHWCREGDERWTPISEHAPAGATEGRRTR